MPAIEYLNSNSNSNSSSPSVDVTLLSIEAGDLLIASVGVMFFTSPLLTSSVSDTAGNTWKRMARTVTGPPAGSNYLSLETWVAIPAVSGDADVIAAATGGGIQINAISMAQFKIPSTLALFSQGGFFENVGDTPRNAYGPTISLPGPGLLWSACTIENNHTVLADGFIELFDQTATGFFLSTAYAIEPQPTVNRHGYNMTVNNTEFIATLTAFRDTADSFADDYPTALAGRGAGR